MNSTAAPSTQWNQRFRRAVRAWYRRHARQLPWRRDRDLYRVWVSEIMLQQTQVATVIPYFERFIQALPTVRALAQADEAEVLRLWEGLGYYRRARQMHRAARMIVERHRGQFPEHVEDVRALPGIGRYTAGAILSIALDQRLPILEGNTVRLFSRLIAFTGDPAGGPGQRLLWGFSENLLPSRSVGEFNQALMDLGSEVCTARRPDCESCPVRLLCEARALGRQHEIPVPASRAKAVRRREAAVVVWRRGRVLLRQCGDHERWAGLWDFPRFTLGPHEIRDQLVERTLDLTGYRIAPRDHVTTIRHTVTKYRIELECYAAQCTGGRKLHTRSLRWVAPGGMVELPLSVTGRRIASLIDSRNPLFPRP